MTRLFNQTPFFRQEGGIHDSAVRKKNLNKTEKDRERKKGGIRRDTSNLTQSFLSFSPLPQ